MISIPPCGASQSEQVPHLSSLPATSSALAVCAHPDDESFGLGALLAALGRDARVSVLCFTHGEASTLGSHADLHRIRAEELRIAADELGVQSVRLLDHPDGRLGEVALDVLVEDAARAVADAHADLLMVFDEGGITGHADHQRATEAALGAANRANLPVLAWALEDVVAEQLNAELGTSFVGRQAQEIDIAVALDRSEQRRAIERHTSQSSGNPVLRRRLQLQGDREVLRWLRR